MQSSDNTELSVVQFVFNNEKWPMGSDALWLGRCTWQKVFAASWLLGAL